MGEMSETGNWENMQKGIRAKSQNAKIPRRAYSIAQSY
jgi:hypothetical protein